jgi:hypothetical protein
MYTTLYNLFSLNIFFEFVCLTAAIICLKEEKSIVWRLMLVLVAVTFVNESLARCVMLFTASHNNQWFYNIYIWFEIVIIHIMFLHLFKHYFNFKLVFIAAVIILGLRYAYDMYNKGFLWYSNITYTIMSVLFVLYSLSYYYLKFKDEEYVDLKFSPEFWWVAGNLFFFFGATACNLFNDQLDDVMLSGHTLTYYVFRLLNFILYGCWSYSFICKKWQATT